MTPAIGRLGDPSQSTCRGPAGGRACGESRDAAVAATFSRQTSLDIVTADGDRVTLSSSFTRTVAAARVTGEDGQAAAAVTTTSRELRLSVEGSLDAEELADIAQILKLLERASQRHGFRSPAGLAQRMAQADLDTLSQVSASTTVTQQAAVRALQPLPPVREPEAPVSPVPAAAA